MLRAVVEEATMVTPKEKEGEAVGRGVELGTLRTTSAVSTLSARKFPPSTSVDNLKSRRSSADVSLC